MICLKFSKSYRKRESCARRVNDARFICVFICGKSNLLTTLMTQDAKKKLILYSEGIRAFWHGTLELFDVADKGRSNLVVG